MTCFSVSGFSPLMRVRIAFSMHLYADGPVSRDEDISVTLSGSASSPRIFVEYMGLKNYWIGG